MITGNAAVSCFALLSELAELRAAGRLPGAAQARAWCAALGLEPGDNEAVAQALMDPYLPAGMLHQVLVQGFRGNPLHPRPRDADDQRLASDLTAYLRLFPRLRRDQDARPELGLPPGGLASTDLVGDGGWCDLCGQCCAHGGTAPNSPPGVDYPPYWYYALAGETLYPQPFCPFLVQTVDIPSFFCAIHPIKPLACSRFDRADCDRGRPHRGIRKG